MRETPGFEHLISLLYLLTRVFICHPHLSHQSSWQKKKKKKKKNGMCSQRKLRSAWTSALSSLYVQWVAKEKVFLYADSVDWSDWADTQADHSLCWALMQFSWFCHGVAHFRNVFLELRNCGCACWFRLAPANWFWISVKMIFTVEPR